MNSVLNVVKSALKLLILGGVVVYDKYKTALVSDPADFLWPKSPQPAVPGFQGRRKSTSAIRWQGSDTCAVFLFYHLSVEI
jgi:hypothetical protein